MNTGTVLLLGAGAWLLLRPGGFAGLISGTTPPGGGGLTPAQIDAERIRRVAQDGAQSGTSPAQILGLVAGVAGAGTAVYTVVQRVLASGTPTQQWRLIDAAAFDSEALVQMTPEEAWSLTLDVPTSPAPPPAPGGSPVTVELPQLTPPPAPLSLTFDESGELISSWGGTTTVVEVPVAPGISLPAPPTDPGLGWEVLAPIDEAGGLVSTGSELTTVTPPVGELAGLEGAGVWDVGGAVGTGSVLDLSVAGVSLGEALPYIGAVVGLALTITSDQPDVNKAVQSAVTVAIAGLTAAGQVYAAGVVALAAPFIMALTAALQQAFADPETAAQKHAIFAEQVGDVVRQVLGDVSLAGTREELLSAVARLWDPNTLHDVGPTDGLRSAAEAAGTVDRLLADPTTADRIILRPFMPTLQQDALRTALMAGLRDQAWLLAALRAGVPAAADVLRFRRQGREWATANGGYVSWWEPVGDDNSWAQVTDWRLSTGAVVHGLVDPAVVLTTWEQLPSPGRAWVMVFRHRTYAGLTALLPFDRRWIADDPRWQALTPEERDLLFQVGGFSQLAYAIDPGGAMDLALLSLRSWQAVQSPVGDM